MTKPFIKENYFFFLCSCVFAIFYVKSLAMFKKQGTSGLPEVTNNIDGTQSCKQHMQLTVDGEGCLNFSNFFLYFLDLEFS